MSGRRSNHQNLIAEIAQHLAQSSDDNDSQPVKKTGTYGDSTGMAAHHSDTPLALPPRGVEPLSENSQVPNSTPVTINEENVLAVCLALLEQKSPDLAAIVRAWPDVPEALKPGIAAMVNAAAN